MENIRYNAETSYELIKKINNFTDEEDTIIIEEAYQKNEVAIKILLRKIKFKLKKEIHNEELKENILEYQDYIQEYINEIEDINLFFEDEMDLEELKDKLPEIERINSILIETDLKLQNFKTAPQSVTSKLPGREELPPIPEQKGDILKESLLKAKNKIKNPEESYSSLEILKITSPPKVRIKLPEEQYENLNKKLQNIGINLQKEELEKLSEAGFNQRINISLLNRIFDTLDEILENYGEIFKERMKNLLLLIALNHLFIYDLSKFYINFEDPKTGVIDKIIYTLNAGLSVTEYLSSIMKVVDILQTEENEVLGNANITGNTKIPYEDWIKINEYEIDLRYKIKEYWERWFESSGDEIDFEEENFQIIDENLEILLDKLTYLELKIERLPHALESPWELSLWIKELFTVIREHSFTPQRWTKIKKVELFMGIFTALEQNFANPNLYTINKGEQALLKLGQRIEFIKDNILVFLREAIETIVNSWQNYKFTKPLTITESIILEKSLIAITLTQTAIDQIQTFYKDKNIMDFIFSTQILSLTNEIFSLGLIKKPLLLGNKKIEDFIDIFIRFHLKQITQEDVIRINTWIINTINILKEKKDIIKEERDEETEPSLIEIFIQNSLAEFIQGQSDLQMYIQTYLRLYLVTSFYSILQGINRLVVLKQLQNEFYPEDEYYNYFDIISDLMDML